MPFLTRLQVKIFAKMCEMRLSQLVLSKTVVNFLWPFYNEICQCFILIADGEETGEGSTCSVAVTTSAPGPTTPGTEAWWKVRLPKNIVPVHYDVLLYIDLKKLEFYGNVEILVNVSSPTDNVLVHVNKMKITSESVEEASSGGWEMFCTYTYTCETPVTLSHSYFQGFSHSTVNHSYHS